MRTEPLRPLLLVAALALTPQGHGQTGARETSARITETETVEAHLGKAYDALKQDRYEIAVNEFRAALDLDPKLTLRARFPLAVALFEMHKSAESRTEFKAVQRDVGDHPNVLYYLGRLDLEDHNYEAAIQNLEKAVARPPFPDTTYYLGFAYLKKGDLAAAEKWLRKAAQANPHDARIPYQLGFVYRQQGRQQQATNAFALSQQLHDQEDHDSRLRVECGQKLDQGLGEQAHEVCDRLYDPEDAEKLTSLGTIYARHGDLEAALKPLQRAADLDPQSPQMQYNLALAYYQLHRFEEARAPLSKAIQRWPDLFQLNALYGAVLLNLGEYASAYEMLEHAHEMNRGDAGVTDTLYLAAVGLARKSREARQFSESIRYLEEAATLKPQEPEPHRQMAEIYRMTGHPEKAATEQKEAERLTTNFSKVQ